MSRHRKKKVESTVPSTYNYNQVRMDTRDTAKGQLISKGLFGILNSSKNRTQKFDLTTVIPQLDWFSLDFGRIWRHQKDISKLTDL